MSLECPKCHFHSGDDWRQCEGKCPISMSPHFDLKTHLAFEKVPVIDAPAPALDIDALESEWLDLAWPEYLVQNLVVAGALCMSFALGEKFFARTFHGWSPGCQKPVEF